MAVTAFLQSCIFLNDYKVEYIFLYLCNNGMLNIFKASFPELLRILLSFVRGKPHIPSWLRNSVVRAVFLVGTTVFLLLARIKVMGAQLPVFTRYRI